MKKQFLLYGVAVAAGILVWVVLSVVTGEKEAWDSHWYFTVGIPVLCVVAALLARASPRRPWRWAILPLLSQALWVMLLQGPGNLWPLTLVFIVVLSVPLLIAAWLGANIERFLGGNTSP